MAEFKVGGKVICIKEKIVHSSAGNKWVYHKDLVYTVREVNTCECGHFSIWLGGMKDTKHIGVLCCAGCNKKTITQKVFVGTKCFVPLDDFKEVTFKEIKEPMCAQ